MSYLLSNVIPRTPIFLLPAKSFIFPLDCNSIHPVACCRSCLILDVPPVIMIVHWTEQLSTNTCSNCFLSLPETTQSVALLSWSMQRYQRDFQSKQYRRQVDLFIKLLPVLRRSQRKEREIGSSKLFPSSFITVV